MPEQGRKNKALALRCLPPRTNLAMLGGMTWEEVCDDPALQDLPYKIELNRWGNIEMSPARNRHGEFQAKISHLMQLHLPDGVCTTECGVRTAENTKVPDVAWVSGERWSVTPHEFAYEVAPEICVEIFSPTNLLAEQLHKGGLYLQAGALEFWICDGQGTMRFFDTGGEIEHSRLCPPFPKKVPVRY